MTIYVGNLSTETTEEELRQSFEQFGKVESVVIVTDKFTRLSKGFAFIEMASKTESQAAVDGLNETEVNGKVLIVAEAKERIVNPKKKKKNRAGKGRKDNAKTSSGTGRNGQGHKKE